ncbi:MAG: hypothetical protein ACFFCQ_02310 [Promethearchaeota archaeon]
MVFDFGGQSQFKTLLNTSSPFLAGASAALVCLDVSRFVIFKNLRFWLDLLNKLPQMPIALEGTKKDKIPVIDQQMIQDLMIERKVDNYFEISCVTGYNILAPFKWAVMVSKKGQISPNSNIKDISFKTNVPILS